MVNVAALSTFRAVDADRTGSISLKEFTNAQGLMSGHMRGATAASTPKAVFNQMDSDKNGKLSVAEFSDGLASVTPDVASLLLKAQEKQSPVEQMLNALKVGAYSSLTPTNGAGGFAFNVLSAYLKA